MQYVVYSHTTHPLLNLCQLGYSDSSIHPKPQKIYIPKGKLPLYIIHYILAGQYSFNGNLLSQGQGFILTPGTEYSCAILTENNYAVLWFSTNDERIKDLLPYFNVNPETGVFCSPPNEIFTPIIRKLQNTRSSLLPAPLLLELFLSVFHEHLKTNRPQAPTSNAAIYVDTAVQYIDSHIHNKITVEEITRFLGVTQPYLFKIFKEHLNQAPKQYIAEQKISLAKRLLRESSLPVWQVAKAVGFEDALHFSKVFSDHTGLSPSRFRQQHRP